MARLVGAASVQRRADGGQAQVLADDSHLGRDGGGGGPVAGVERPQLPQGGGPRPPGEQLDPLRVSLQERITRGVGRVQEGEILPIVAVSVCLHGCE